MRRLTACVLMMTLMLSGCQAGGMGESPEEEALAVRDAYQDMAGWSAGVEVTAAVGDKVFDFALSVQWQREGETVLTVTAPELLHGITARIAKGETLLEYDGAGVSLGLLDGDGLTAVSAVTGVMEQIDRGYMAQCTWTGEGDQLLQITCRDPEREPNTGTEYVLTFERDSWALRSAEVSVDGVTVLTANFSNFTTELKADDTGDGTNMG